MNLRDGYAAILEVVSRAWQPKPKITVSEWADEKRQLPAKASPEPGPWRTDRTPFWREPMDVLSDHHPCEKMSLMAASQMGKSEVMNNWIGYSIDHAPAPMLMVEPTVDLCEKYSKQRIEPMIDASPDLRSKVPSARKRDSGNTTLVKEFPAGLLVMVGANSPSGLASMPIKKAAFDETDRYPLEAGDQGSPIKQGEQRTVAFPRHKIGHFSTPVRLPIEDDDGNETGGSHIWREYMAGSRGRYFVPCPHCGFLQVLDFKNLRWSKMTGADGKTIHQPETAVYMCQGPDCGVGIEERYKPDMLADAKMGGSARWVHEFPERLNEHASYQINALYSPIGLGRSWKKIVEEWLEACRDRSKLITFWNLILGLPFDDHADRIKDGDLYALAEDYEIGRVPPGYYLLTMATDTQGDRLEYEVKAWGRNERCVTVDYGVIYGNPQKEEVWKDLTKQRHRRYPNCRGLMMSISMTGIDTGGSATQQVYRYARDCKHDNVIALKGNGDPKRPILSRPKKQDVKNERGEIQRNGVNLWIVGTYVAKQALFSRLAEWQAEDAPLPHDRLIRMTQRLGGQYYRGLTAEVFEPSSGKYIQLRKGNEPIDLHVYNHAVACHPKLRVERKSASDWDYLESIWEPRNTDLFAQAQASAPAQADQHTQTSAEQTAAAAPNVAAVHPSIPNLQPARNRAALPVAAPVLADDPYLT